MKNDNDLIFEAYLQPRVETLLPEFRKYVSMYGKSSGITRFALEKLGVDVQRFNEAQKTELVAAIKKFQQKTQPSAQTESVDNKIDILAELIAAVFGDKAFEVTVK